MNRKTYDNIRRYFDTRQEAKDYLETLHKAGKEHARMTKNINIFGTAVYKVFAYHCPECGANTEKLMYDYADRWYWCKNIGEPGMPRICADITQMRCLHCDWWGEYRDLVTGNEVFEKEAK